MAERGLDVGHEEVARAARVTVGTDDNRFPAPRELAQALFGGHVEQVVHLAEQASGVADPWEALTGFMTGTLAHRAGDHGLHQFIAGTAPGLSLASMADERIAPSPQSCCDGRRPPRWSGPTSGNPTSRSSR